uniref:Uncharacterized protein n=1 Tax=Anguilla anguilla TaxID=7936 RepID=A0A0E9UDL9_ANGAN
MMIAGWLGSSNFAAEIPQNNIAGYYCIY